MTLLVTDAIVLHSFDYLESSRILRLLTREAGVRSVLARGGSRHGHDLVEGVRDGVEQVGVGAFVRAPQRHLGDGGGAVEAVEVFGELRARAAQVESAQRIEVASRLGVQLGRPLGVEIERRTKPTL